MFQLGWGILGFRSKVSKYKKTKIELHTVHVRAPDARAPLVHHHTFNKYVRKFNKTALASGTYDVNTLLMRVPKPGEATNVKINKEAFISSDACWRLQGNLVTHFSNFKMAEVLSDIRKFLEDDFKTNSATPTL